MNDFFPWELWHGDGAMLRLITLNVLVQRAQELFGVTRAANNAGPHLCLWLLRLHVDEVKDKLGLVMIDHHQIRVCALRYLVIELNMDIYCGLFFRAVVGHVWEFITNTGDLTEALLRGHAPGT